MARASQLMTFEKLLETSLRGASGLLQSR